MNIYIALFRGINVGGRNKLPMKELTALLEELGCRDVKTYIQSGNVVLRHSRKSVSRLSTDIGARIKKEYGFEPKVLILTLAEFRQAAEANPFPDAEADPKSLHVTFLDAEPKQPDLKALEKIKAGSERFKLKGNVFYLHAPEGVGRSKLAANAERLIGVPMTDRNWRTVSKLIDMAGEIE